MEKTTPCFIGRPSIHVSYSRVLPHGQSRPNHHPWLSVTITFQLCSIGSNPFLHGQTVKPSPIGSMYAIYGNIYHQYTPNVSIYIPYMDPMVLWVMANLMANDQNDPAVIGFTQSWLRSAPSRACWKVKMACVGGVYLNCLRVAARKTETGFQVVLHLGTA